MTITIGEIKSIIAGAEETLRLLQKQPEYQAIEKNENFVTQNELVLADPIQSLSEIYQAIEESECDFASAIVTNPQRVKEDCRDVLDLLGN